jgi:dolichyl-phosphate-mannose--protein O-mannosyl transferase
VTQTATGPADPDAAPSGVPAGAVEECDPAIVPPWRTDRFWGWAAPLLVTLIGALLRFWHLDRPRKLIFDEVYYVKEAYSYLRYGYEVPYLAAPPGAGDPFTQGHPGGFGTGASFVVHPPVGKWMIAAGEWLLGADTPWGWRSSSAVVGTLSILMLARIARRLLGSTLLGTLAGLLLALDGQHVVHSRTGLLDIFVMFWALAGFGCLLVDRDRAGARLADAAIARWNSDDGPWLGLRWWRVAGFGCLGLCTGVKWSGLFFAAVFGLMSVLWDAGNRRAAGVRTWLAGTLRLDAVQAAATAAVVVPAVYLASWTGWLRGTGGYDRHWAERHPAQAGFGWVPDVLRSLWHFHAEMWNFNINLHLPHAYQSNPWSWLVLGRPTAFFYDKHGLGDGGCPVGECNQVVLPLGNPMLWWAATLLVGVLLFRWALTRDWRAGAILAGLAGGYLPWFLYQERTIFSFYAIAFTPWVVLVVTYGLGLALGPPDAGGHRRLVATSLLAGYLVLVVLTFGYFYPIYTAQLVPHPSWLARMWLPSWI